jgi:STAS-like domain of unknown function (DUF4325)
MGINDKNDLVKIDGSEIIFNNLTNPKVVSDFIKAMNDFISAGKTHLILNFKNTQAAFPNVCTPIAGIIANLRSKGIVFEFYYLSEYLKKLLIDVPMSVQANRDIAQKASLDKIWRFDCADDAYLLIKSFVKEISQVVVCEKGVLEGFDWAINEILDNVLQHSGKNYGYVMGQVHRESKHFVFCVYDTGRGIYNSLLDSVHMPNSPVHALQLAVKEGITRDKKIGQGNGLWGLHQIVIENTGMLNIISNSAAYCLTNEKATTFTNLPQLSYDNGCIVDFQIEFSKGISISKALGGYEPVNLNMESLENNLGDIVIELQNKESGVGTRISGAIIRNEVVNVNKQTGKTITLDFDNISIISSSFADELIGKLVLEFGFYGFNNIVKLKHMNQNVQSIVQRSVAQRMMESFGKKDSGFDSE